MSAAGNKILAGMREALAVARGQIKPARVRLAAVPQRKPVSTVILNITSPISKNALRTVANGRFIDSSAYRRWKHDAGWEIAQQRPGRIVGRYALFISLSRSFGIDLGNCEQSVSDLLKTTGIIEDDSLADHIVLGWGFVAGVVITVTSTKALEAA